MLTKSITTVLALLAIVSVVACTEKATKEDCDKMFDNLVTVGAVSAGMKPGPDLDKIIADDRAKDREKDLKECVGTPKSAVVCMSNAKVKEDIDKCK